MKITKVYTRTGDKGMTSLVGGVRIKKSNLRLEAYGTVDELSSQLGMLISLLPNVCDEYRQGLLRIQNNLFNVCSHLATDQSQTMLYSSGQLSGDEISFLESQIDGMMQLLPERQGFVLPGGCMPACQAHICRTVCRRAERRIAALAEGEIVGEEIQQYVNRLSDYLFVLAKIINFNTGVQEILWENACR